MIKIKLNIAIILLSLLCYGYLTFGQSSITNTSVTLNCKNQPLRTVLQEIKKQTNIKFVYSDALVDSKLVTCHFINLPIRKALQQITEQSKLSFKFQSDESVVLFNKMGNLSTKGTIYGHVIDALSKSNLSGANVFLAGTTLGASTDESGEFIISNIPSGSYNLKCKFIGYETITINDIAILESSRIYFNIEMDIKPLKLSEVVVTPSRFAIMGISPNVRQILTRKDIESIPHFGDDIYRTVRRLPGLYANDFSARFAVRGGEHDQILVLMDGLELYEPFHLRYILGGALSIIDVAAIEGIELMTGGFTAEYGDCMSGVFNIKSRKVPANQKRFLLGVSSINTRLISEGSFLGNKGSWLVSARRGYFDLVLKLTEAIEDIPSPFYYDILSRIQYQISKKHNILANVLHAKDRLVCEENNGGEINNRYGNTCGWLRLESNFNPRLFVGTVISTGHVDYNRMVRGRYNRDQNLYYSVSDQRDFRFYGLKQDWNLELCDQYDLKWGLDMKKLIAPYDYLSEPQNSIQTRNNYRCDTTKIIIRPSGRKFGAYLSNRFRLISPLTIEIGCRYDYASYTNDKLFSPRFNLVYALGQQTFIRSGWGHFYQTQGIHELQAQDGEDTFSPAELAEHRVIGFEHVFKRGIYMRLEGYCKKLSHLRPVYRNWQQLIDISPEMSSDRLKILLDGSTAKGIEIYLKKDSGGKLTWWASYALAYVSDNVVKVINRDKEKQYNNKELPSVFDQRHTLYFDINYRPNSKWQFHLAWQYHTGCPFTKLVPEKLLGFWNEMGEFNSSRYPPYHRMDIRINRHFNIHRGSITAFLEIVNLYNFRNVACFDYAVSYWLDSQLHGIVSKRPEYWFPFLPSIGINCSWGK